MQGRASRPIFRDRKSCRKWKRNKALKYGLPAVVWSNYWLAGGWGLIKTCRSHHRAFWALHCCPYQRREVVIRKTQQASVPSERQTIPNPARVAVFFVRLDNVPRSTLKWIDYKKLPKTSWSQDSSQSRWAVLSVLSLIGSHQLLWLLPVDLPDLSRCNKSLMTTHIKSLTTFNFWTENFGFSPLPGEAQSDKLALSRSSTISQWSYFVIIDCRHVGSGILLLRI